MDTPAGNTSGQSPTPTDDSSQATVELPAKLRVHALAKQLGASSREVITTLESLGESVRSAQSNITRDVALRVVRALRPEQLVDNSDEGRAAADGDQGVSPSVDGDEAASSEPDTSSEPAGMGFSAAAETQPTAEQAPAPAGLSPLFEAPQATFLAAAEPAPASSKPDRSSTEESQDTSQGPDSDADDADDTDETDDTDDEDSDQAGRRRRRRGRRGRGRGRGGDGEQSEADDEPADEQRDKPGRSDKNNKGAKADKPDKSEKSEKSEKKSKKDKKADKDGGSEQGDGSGPKEEKSSDDSDDGSSRRRRRRRRKGTADEEPGREDDPPNTVVHTRESAPEKDSGGDDEVRAIKGSTRLEAKRQRRRDGREAGRRRAPVLSESEFLARRESVERRMVVREHGEQTQIAVLEDNVLVENFVTSSGSGSLVGNVYLGRVQNVLPSMEAAFVDIGKGRNAVIYAGEVDWDSAGLAGKSRRIEQALSSGDSVLVQVTKDPIGHKGARLTTQVSLPGRFLVYVPGGSATGISRKLPDTERKRLKEILKRIVPENAGVIIRTASEGTSEESLERDVKRLQAQWDVIKEKSEQPKAQAPQLLYEEPDLLIKVIRDLFTEDFESLTVQGDTAWDTIEAYVNHVAPDLMDRLYKHTGKNDVFTEQRINEQISKALDRKVWLPSGGYLIIDRTEAMTVIDVNTGKFTGSGGNLEETVTRNNLESAEEIVRQLRLRDIGGIIVIDFIDMVLESNRDLVLRRLTECLGRDRTRHQVAEVTSLGLVQMTRKRVGTGLLEAYSNTCEHCRGRGVLVTTDLATSAGGGKHEHSGKHEHKDDQKSEQKQDGGKPDKQERRKRGKGQQSDSPAVEAAAETTQAEKTSATPDEQKPDAPAEQQDDSRKGRDRRDKADQRKSGQRDKAEQRSGRDESKPAPVLEPRGMADSRPQQARPEEPAADSSDAGDKQPADSTTADKAAREKVPSGRSRRRKVSRPTGSAGETATPVVAEPAPAEPTPSVAPAAESAPSPATEPSVAPEAAPASVPAGDGAASEAAGRSRRRKVSRPTGSAGASSEPVVVDAAAAESSAAQPNGTAAPEPAASEPAASEPAVSESAPEAAPVRRSRRRSASRPAGPAAGDA